MSDDIAKSRRQLRKQLPAPTYTVGYRKPPEGSRFQKGRSGNPAGRPRGAKNKPPALNEERMKSIILEEAYRTITVRDGEKNVTVPMAQAVIRSLAVNAARGNHRSQRLFSELLAATETANKRLYDEWLDTALNYKVQWERELERRKRLGIEAPDPVPHPDHINVNFFTGQIEISGPMTKKDKEFFDEVREAKPLFEQEIEDLRAALEDPDCDNRAELEAELQKTIKVLQIINNTFRE